MTIRFYTTILLTLLMSLSVAAQHEMCTQRYALLVGISNYSLFDQKSCGRWTDIHGVNDVMLIQDDLTKHHFNVTKLLDADATYQNITCELGKLSRQTGPGDIVYIHFSTHGQPYEDLDGDEEDGWDEAIVPFDALKEFQRGIYEGECHLTDDKLSTYVRDIRKTVGTGGMVYVVVDACHAGNSGERGMEEGSVVVRGTSLGFSGNDAIFCPMTNRKTHFQLDAGSQMSDVTFIEACRSDQRNVEIKVDEVFYGPLSYYIHKVITSDEPVFDEKSDWVRKVERLMNSDRSLSNQDMVIESTIPMQNNSIGYDK